MYIDSKKGMYKRYKKISNFLIPKKESTKDKEQNSKNDDDKGELSDSDEDNYPPTNKGDKVASFPPT